MLNMRKRINKWVGNICWDIGDWFFGQWVKRIDRDDMKNWHTIDIHANCRPKTPAGLKFRTVSTNNFPVTFSASTGTSWFADWDSPEDSAYDDK